MIVITVARKPISGSVVGNIVQWGTCGLNIDACRIGYEDTPNVASNPLFRTQQGYSFKHGSDRGAAFQIQKKDGDIKINPAGRWPSNVILGQNAVAAMDKQSSVTKNIVRHMSYQRSGGEFIDGIPSQPEKGWHVTEPNKPSRFFKQVKE